MPADPLAAELAQRFRSGASGTVLLPDGRPVFLTVHLPPPRLIAIGAVHISQALAPMAEDRRLRHDDRRSADCLCHAGTLPRCRHDRGVAGGRDLARLGLDAFTAVAALTHDPRIDDHALAAALKAGCFYVGALGSRKTHAKRLERLRGAGLRRGRRSPASMRRSAWPSAPSRRPRSPSPFWRRSSWRSAIVVSAAPRGGGVTSAKRTRAQQIAALILAAGAVAAHGGGQQAAGDHRRQADGAHRCGGGAGQPRCLGDGRHRPRGGGDRGGARRACRWPSCTIPTMPKGFRRRSGPASGHCQPAIRRRRRDARRHAGDRSGGDRPADRCLPPGSGCRDRGAGLDGPARQSGAVGRALLCASSRRSRAMPAAAA